MDKAAKIYLTIIIVGTIILIGTYVNWRFTNKTE